jgi:hypothetical protein
MASPANLALSLLCVYGVYGKSKNKVLRENYKRRTYTFFYSESFPSDHTHHTPLSGKRILKGLSPLGSFLFYLRIIHRRFLILHRPYTPYTQPLIKN